jgi:pimeloyl-ACP methyl ester carboxylesterase
MKLAVEKTSGRGSPVVFLHGLMDSKESYLPIANQLTRPTLLIDLPGFGKSKPRLTGDFFDWVDLVEKTINKEVKSDYLLVGHSLGGALASQIANQDSGKIKGLVLVSPAGYSKILLADLLSQPGSETILDLTAPRAMGSKFLIKNLYRMIFSHNGTIDDQLLDRLITGRYQMKTGTKEAMQIVKYLSKHQFEENNYQGPVTVIFGEKDLLTPTKNSTKKIKEIFPSPEINVLEGVGHHPQDEDRKHFLKILNKALGN